MKLSKIWRRCTPFYGIFILYHACCANVCHTAAKYPIESRKRPLLLSNSAAGANGTYMLDAISIVLWLLKNDTSVAAVASMKWSDCISCFTPSNYFCLLPHHPWLYPICLDHCHIVMLLMFKQMMMTMFYNKCVMCIIPMWNWARQKTFSTEMNRNKWL